MCEPSPDPSTPTEDHNELLVQAMVKIMDESLDSEGSIRRALQKVGFDDPESTVEECVVALVQSHLRLSVPA